MKIISSVMAIAVAACAGGAALGQTPDQPEPLQVSALQERYKQNAIYLTSAQLNGFRNHLRRVERRRVLDTQTEPIPSACRLFERFLDKAFSNLEPGFGVAFVQIDLQTSRAYLKMDSDTSGSLQEIEWTKDEVLSVAILIDTLLQGLDTVRKITHTAGLSSDGIALSWTQFSTMSNSPYISEDAWGSYLMAVKNIVDKEEMVLGQIKDSDQRAYSEIKTFLANSAVLERSLTTGLTSKFKSMHQLRGALQSQQGRLLITSATAKVTLDQAMAAMDLKKLAPSEASRIVATELLPAYSAAIKAKDGPSSFLIWQPPSATFR